MEATGLPNQMVVAVGAGFVRVPDLALLEPYVERYHAMLLDAWKARSVAIGERVVDGFYPMRLTNAELLAATEAWLAANTEAPPGLFRLVAENRDTLARALRVQARDAQD